MYVKELRNFSPASIASCDNHVTTRDYGDLRRHFWHQKADSTSHSLENPSLKLWSRSCLTTCVQTEYACWNAQLFTRPRFIREITKSSFRPAMGEKLVKKGLKLILNRCFRQAEFYIRAMKYLTLYSTKKYQAIARFGNFDMKLCSKHNHAPNRVSGINKTHIVSWHNIML